MVVDSISTLTTILLRTHLLERSQIAEVASSLQNRFPNPKSLAGELIRRGWLTPYQVNQIFQDREGDLLLDSYVLLERLGEGGMGQVFKARNWKLDRLVALKVVRKDRLGDAEAIRRFQREVRASAQLNHPNVVHAYDSGECGDRHFYVMEYVEGIDLARLVRRDGPLPIEQACDCIRQAALGLQHAVERGLVHRDIKPHNLLMTRSSDGQTLIKILDMGLARLDHGGDPLESGTMTREGVVMGTLDYIAPEQARNAHLADTRADLYSLGCTLFFLLAGRPPFHGGTPTERLLKHQIDPPPPVARFRPDVPPSLAAVLERLLAKRPEHRYQTPAETAAVLAAVLSGAPVPQRPTASPLVSRAPARATPTPQAMKETDAGWSSIVEAPSAADSASSFHRRRAAQHRRTMWWSVAAGVALLAVLGLILLLH
ncbi:MAG TPA: serine/threonine-protein kinase [Gemmataceae bacterium]|nr:serine/threonine-protein kinase [Gemmataceae bacterium]